MALIKRIKNKILLEIAKLSRPHIIGGYRRSDGSFLKDTRISNSTFIDYKENLDIKDNVFIGHYNFIEASGGITIKEGCQLTNFISITTHSSHISIRLYGKEYGNYPDKKGYIKGPVYIGEYSFIGPHSLIMPDTHIGKGSIVAAYSYVQGDFPDFAIIKGNPAVVVGSTKDIDSKYIEEYPELKKFYSEWANKI
ncbi:MAG: acyltransferase [Bacteroidales bacterium]|nr:acyltransferase [Bacteroidales bacterium]